jgi:hypothetical protein
MPLPDCTRPREGGGCCKRRTCPRHAVLWAGDTRRKLLVNVDHYGGDVALVTVTAPGRDQLFDAYSTRAWNDDAPRRWTLLHRAARQRAVRRHGVLANLAGAWEEQQRGALHRHQVLGARTARERAAAHTYALALDELRHKYGFGFVDGGTKGPQWRKQGLPTRPAGTGARYLAKYVAKLDDRGQAHVHGFAELPRQITWVTPRLSRSTGCTMRTLRLARVFHMRGIQADPFTGETLGSILARAQASGTPEELQSALARLAPT